MKGENPEATIARHDLFFGGPGQFGARWNNRYEGLATGFEPESVKAALAMKRRLLKRNPRLLLLAEIRYRDAGRDYLPPDHPWWKRDSSGKKAVGWEEGGYYVLDFANAAYQDQVARQAKAATENGVFDGVMLDWWVDDGDRLQLAKKIRAAIGRDALILVNANDHPIPNTAAYVNGLFMECFRSESPEDWKRIAETLEWAEHHLRSPKIDCLETWWHHSRRDESLMRATTALSLTLSDGYCLFSDPNPLPTPDHLHDWYGFWSKSLGKPLSPGRKRPDGAYERTFERGTVVYNPMGNAFVATSFPFPRISRASGANATRFVLPPADGDFYLLENEKE